MTMMLLGADIGERSMDEDRQHGDQTMGLNNP